MIDHLEVQILSIRFSHNFWTLAPILFHYFIECSQI